MHRHTVRNPGRLLPALCVVFAGCASVPQSVRELPADADTIELADTPFFPQERYQCGPTALTTALVASGADVALDDIVRKVYLPGREGSLQVDMLGATRTSGRIPYLIDGMMSALHDELAAGRVVVVLQNLGVAALPKWHYAVVVGIDPGTADVVLRSGKEHRRVTAVDTFLRTWRRSGYWGFVVLPPGDLPANVDRIRYFESVAAVEQAGQYDAAVTAWQAALHEWPGDTTAMFGLANAQYAGGHADAAERSYRELLVRRPDLVVARNNLAMSLAKQGKFDQALVEIDTALASTPDGALQAELQDTRDLVLDQVNAAQQ